MIDIDLTDPIGEIRALVGDPTSEFVSDATIISAIAKYSGNLNKASLLLMSMMLTAFSTLADRERVDQVEVYYTNLFERYTKRFNDLKRQLGSKSTVPIYIGGTKLSVKNAVVEDLDNFSLYQQHEWHDIQLGNKTLVEQEIYRYRL